MIFPAIGFLPDSRRPKRYVDVWQDDETTTGLLPPDAQVVAAFALSRALHPEGCAFAAGSLCDHAGMLPALLRPAAVRAAAAVF